MKKKTLSIVFTILLLFPSFSFANENFEGPPIFESIQDQLNASGSSSGLRSAQQGGLRGYVAKIIKGTLGFLATIALVLIIYAGFLWMTSGGNEEQVTKAQTLLKNAFIGLLIVILSYSITIFVFRSLLSQQR